MIALSGTKTDNDVFHCGVPQQPPTAYMHKTTVSPK